MPLMDASHATLPMKNEKEKKKMFYYYFLNIIFKF